MTSPTTLPVPPWLVINPNTSSHVTGLLHRHVAATVDGPVHSATARFGAPYIADEASYAVASHATLDAWAAALSQGLAPAGVLIGCFGDPGLLALREASDAPVTGLAEASFIEGRARGRFAIVTGGVKWVPMLERLALGLGFADALAGIHAVAPTGAQMASDPEGALAVLREGCAHAARSFQADVVILGGAGLAGLAARLQPLVDVPLIDSVQAGARVLQQLKAESTPACTPRGFDCAWQGLSKEMTELGRLP